jgi:hypothetical protein
MSRLTKTLAITYIPADPGHPGFPGTPATITIGGTNCSGGSTVKGGLSSGSAPSWGSAGSSGGGSYGDYVPAYTPTYDAQGQPVAENLVGGVGSTVGSEGIPEGKCGFIGYQLLPTKDGFQAFPQYLCVPKTQQTSQCYTYRVPESERLPPIPAQPPTPAQTIKSFQEGWNASAQSIRGLLPGKAVRFNIGFGARGVLVGFNYEPWVPNVNNMPIGIMFYDGQAKIYENGVFKESFGYFFRGQSFLIGRSKDNKIVYMNETDGLTQIRYVNVAPPTIPVHVFAVSYYGGDTVY